MRVAIIGQQDFGKATMEAASSNRGDEVAAVFCAPEKGPGPDPAPPRRPGEGG